MGKIQFDPILLAMSIKLLIADDAPFIIQVTKSLIESRQIHVVGEAIDGEDAVKKALELKPDAIFMDMVMPNKNGVEATKEILTELPETKIIAVSTLDDDFMKEKALNAGCSDYIIKPFNRGDLIKSLERALGVDLS